MRFSRTGLLRFLAYQASFTMLGFGWWFAHTFGRPSIDQVIYHLRVSEASAMALGSIFFLTFGVEVLLLPLLAAALAAMAHAVVAGRGPAWWRRGVHALPALAGAAATGALLLQFSVFSYAAAHFEPDPFDAHYVHAGDIPVQPHRPRNLVLIYAESLETAYGDRALFGRDLLAPLHALGGQQFAEFLPAEGANWTIAGMVATQCGVPLKYYVEHGMRQVRPGQRIFLPGAVCLGDLLQAHGYHNVFMGGAPLSFAAKGQFLQDHGYAERWGRDEWERAGVPVEDFNKWGLYDHALLGRARERLAELHAAGKPFSLTLLTLDTHNPAGFRSPACISRGVRAFEDIVECVSDDIAQFVRFARERGFLEDTVVVIMGDHLAAPNPVWDKLQQAPRRHVFNMIFSPDALQPNRQDLRPYDFYPTLLALAGFTVPGGRLGLGFSAYGEAIAGRPPGGVNMRLASLRSSRGYDRLWREAEAVRPH